MLCTSCKKRLASVHLKALVGNHLVERHLCAECAQREALEAMEGPGPLLAGLLAALTSSARRPAQACPACKTTWAAFQKTGRLGCARCYETFAAPLSRVLQKVHQAEGHGGKRPAVDALSGPETVESLQARLRAAVEKEDYETAARLHARIKELQR